MQQKSNAVKVTMTQKKSCIKSYLYVNYTIYVNVVVVTRWIVMFQFWFWCRTDQREVDVDHFRSFLIWLDASIVWMDPVQILDFVSFFYFFFFLSDHVTSVFQAVFLSFFFFFFSAFIDFHPKPAEVFVLLQNLLLDLQVRDDFYGFFQNTARFWNVN